ncbi:transglycosylase domain-containing protein [Ruminococcus sp.]|uniref:transglycosylase domain-containing protein n=1 Tax=Ruminococcus sp. TaxID=41978 RepID=UPI0025F61C85|nr:transglycosylase domain-containing protein [Ruminococcus sp.]MCI6616988.1 transglycosylase domain-containing protein [Ruminococcus sp.]
MRNKRETDISRYTDKSADNGINEKSESGVKRFFKGLCKFLITAFTICFVALFIAGISLSIYIFTLASEPTGIDLKAKSLNQTSFIYIKDDKTGEFKEYQTLYSTENRIWVDNQDIPQAMKDAVVAIEDKRFYDHNGVDWARTLSAVVNLATGEDTYGGSTITQQLIKNITDDNEVSINRKLREICKALKLEDEYTKDQILEAYLNVVNFGNNCQGVESAAQLYFDKSIKDCSIAECAAIAGITQNPSLWNPLIYPDNNKQRREIVINEMYDQGKITKSEYDNAMKESANMTFVGFKNTKEDDDDNDYVQNWYIDQVFYDLREDLALYYNISEEAASEKLYTEGLKIYCAMDEKMQSYMEEAAQSIDKTYDSELQIGSVLMGFDGRVIATVGSSKKKTQALEWDRATHSKLQPGSSIKPVIVYPYAIDNKMLYYSSVVKDEPINNWKDQNGQLVSGPNNAYYGYNGDMLLPDAIEWSSNATAVQTMNLIGGPSVAYEQAVTKMGFKSLSEQDTQNTGALSMGGMNGGVSVREMAAAYNYLGNGGLYYEPYTYYYVTDSEDNIIIDNREAIPKQAYSAETASIMNRLLSYNVTNSAHTNAQYSRISGWDIIGKTGTTDEDKDSWFCGLSPYATMATWCGFDQPASISNTSTSARFFSNVMGKYLEGKEQKEYNLSPNLVEAQYNPYNGLIVTTDSPMGKYIGYYTEDNMPAMGGYYDYNADNSNYSSDNSGEESGSGENSGGENSGGENSGDSSGGENSGGESSGGESSNPEGGESSNPEGGGSEGSDAPAPVPEE